MPPGPVLIWLQGNCRKKTEVEAERRKQAQQRRREARSASELAVVGKSVNRSAREAATGSSCVGIGARWSSCSGSGITELVSVRVSNWSAIVRAPAGELAMLAKCR